MKQDRIILICPAADRDATNQLFVDLFSDEAQRETISVPLNAAGDDGEPTHFACSIQLIDEQAQWFKDEAKARGLHLRWRRTDALTDELIETTSGKARGAKRKVDAMSALDEMGVKMRRVKDNEMAIAGDIVDSVEVAEREKRLPRAGQGVARIADV